MLVLVLALRACFLADIPAPDTLDHLHPGLSCSQIPVHSVTHLLVVAVAAAGAWYLGAHHQGENQIHLLQCRKDQMDSSHHRCPKFSHFIAFLLADFAATPHGCCACVGQVVVCRASSLHLSMLRQKSEKCP